MDRMFFIAACMAVPISVITMLNNNAMSNKIDALTDIVARQHNINPQSIGKNKDRLPYIRRNIVIKDVSFNDKGIATIKLYDGVTPGIIYTQKGCPSLVKFVNKELVVDYHTVNANYAIDCIHTKSLGIK